MATNIVFDEGVELSLVPDVGPNDPVESSDPVLVGRIPGVALTDGDDALGTGRATVKMNGVADLEVEGATSAGDIIHMTAAGVLTATVGTNVRFGYALEEQAATGTIRVKVGY